MALDETIAENDAGHIAAHEELRTAYLNRGSGRTLPVVTGYGSTHNQVHATLHAEHNSLGATTVLPTAIQAGTAGHLSHHDALHKAHNLRQNTTGVQPISTAAPSYPAGTSAFPPNPSRHTLTTQAKPTNAWFQNFMVGTGQQPINMYPYMLKIQQQGLNICVPLLTAQSRYVISTMLQNTSLLAVEAIQDYKLIAFTNLGCTLRWTASGGTMTADVVRGMAYTTMHYTNLRPQVSTIHAITSINGAAPGATMTGTKFKIVLNNGQTWLMYTSTSMSFTTAASNLTATNAFTGSVRLAVLPTGTGAESALDNAAASIPTGGNATVTVSGNVATEVFTWNTVGTGTPLMYCLPHHESRLQNTSILGYTLSTLRGTMRAVSGTTWTLNIPIQTVGWNNINPPASNRLSAIQTALTTDKNFVPAVNDSYFGPKQLAKSARLACIADHIGDTASRTTIINNMKPILTNYINNQLGTKLRYDTAWGGIVSEAGLTSDQVDFGNGMYNDHHFHYGYVIQAAATVARFDPSWLTDANKAKINDLVRDIANPSTSDPYFTPYRLWDFYEGHSWAAGHFEFGDNRNQESTSEAVNGWYAVQLWGEVTNNTQVRDIGRWLMSEEIAAAQRYWQIKQADSIYSSPYKENGYVAILWSNKVDANTWFGAQAEYGIGIQMLPTNPTTEALIPTSWMSELWPNKIVPDILNRTYPVRSELINGGSGYVPAYIKPDGQGVTDGMSTTGGTGTGLKFNCNITNGQIVGAWILFGSEGSGYSNGDIVNIVGSGGSGAQVRIFTQAEDGWKAVLYSGYAPVNPTDAWDKTAALTAWDDGSSRTQHLYHIATQTATDPGGPSAGGLGTSALGTGPLGN